MNVMWRVVSGAVAIILVLSLVLCESNAFAEGELKGTNLQAYNLASKARDEISNNFEQLLKSRNLSLSQLFDTFYIPIPNSYPQKYHTQYDKVLDNTIQNILDNYLKKSSHFIYFIISDVNGYVPTHNSKYSQPLTGNKEIDSIKNRTKVIFNDRTGLAAAKNTAQYLLQEYSRDTGETIYDLSVPIYTRNQHWGCVRVGFTK